MTGSTNNTWGLGFSETFDVFGSTANNDPSFNMAIPNRFFDGIEGLPTALGQRGVRTGYQSIARSTPCTLDAVHPAGRCLQRLHGGAGHALHGAGVPEGVLEPHRVHQRADGAPHRPGDHGEAGRRFVTRDGWNLAAGAEEWFAPVTHRLDRTARSGSPMVQLHHPAQPDAARVQQRPRERLRVVAPRSSPRPDLPIAYRGRGAGEAIAVDERHGGTSRRAPSDNMLWRLTAQRLLVERGQKDVVPQLFALVKNTAVDAIGINGGAMHALWTLKVSAKSTRRPARVRGRGAALKHPAAGVRKAAAMVLPKTASAAAI